MAKDQLETFHLLLMQEYLPVGLALMERASKGGPKKVMQAWTELEEPLDQLRTEGDAKATLLRDQLDKIRPGLGNPVVSVDVVVNTSKDINDDDDINVDEDSINDLFRVLNRIDKNLKILDDSIDADLYESSSNKMSD
tara:strand:+ start:296 stop:709 length:414 start_codon:yes stop_codon:yes gene_type:complete